MSICESGTGMDKNDALNCPDCGSHNVEPLLCEVCKTHKRIVSRWSKSRKIVYVRCDGCGKDFTDEYDEYGNPI